MSGKQIARFWEEAMRPLPKEKKYNDWVLTGSLEVQFVYSFWSIQKYSI